MFFSKKEKIEAENKKIRHPIKGALLGLAIGFACTIVLSQFGQLFAGILLCVILAYLGFVFIDKKDYQLKLKLEEQNQKLKEVELKKEAEKQKRKLSGMQKKNREDKSSLYQNIFTVAGYVLAPIRDLEIYAKNADEVLAGFNVNRDEHILAVNSFNDALEPDFDIQAFVENYKEKIGPNREYIACVISHAYVIASQEDFIEDVVKKRLEELALSMKATKVFLNRLFESHGAEARFAQYFIGFDGDKSKKKKKEQPRVNKDPAFKTREALQILGLDLKASFDDVKKSYKRMMFKYHPDRLAAQKDLSSDMVAVLTEKAKAVQVAYDYLKSKYQDIA